MQNVADDQLAMTLSDTDNSTNVESLACIEAERSHPNLHCLEAVS